MAMLCVLIGEEGEGARGRLVRERGAAGYKTLVARSRREAITLLGLDGWTLADLEQCALDHTLAAVRNNKAAAARSLGVSEKTIYNKLKRRGK